MTSFTYWKKKQEEWRSKYPQVLHEVIITPLSSCEKCGSKYELNRHHKGNDFWFAERWEEAFAARYIQYCKDDIVILCSSCHKKVHRVIYKRVQWELNAYVKMNNVSLEKLHSFRSRFISACDRWLTYKLQKKRKKKNV